MKLKTSIFALLATTIAGSAYGEGEVNLYSSRHYDTDERLYADFTDATGITDQPHRRQRRRADRPHERRGRQFAGRRLHDRRYRSHNTRQGDGSAAAHRERGAGDPHPGAYLQDADNQWFAFSQARAHPVLRQERCGKPAATYQDLAKPEYEGMVCIRSSSNVYTQNIVAALVAHLGEEAMQDWAKAVVNNFARDPQGGDTDQLRGIVSGECDIAMSNTYYFARALRRDVSGLSDSPI
jgi:iron(III) transport system substrate-binding protein